MFERSTKLSTMQGYAQNLRGSGNTFILIITEL